MNRSLSELLQGLDTTLLQGSSEVAIRGLATDSRRVAPGSLFFALPGLRTAGHLYIEEAVQRGAVAVVTEDQVWAPRTATHIRVPQVRQALVTVAQRYYNYPQQALRLVGIAGTAGKTVVAQLVQHLLQEERPVGLLGTISYDLGGRRLPAARTTPDPVDLYSMLDQMRQVGCREAVLEVSSHGLHQGRVAGLPFQVAAFLNLTPEHLSYHGSMEAYFESVRALFDGRNGPVPSHTVLNVDDPYGLLLWSELRGRSPLFSYGFSAEADLQARAPVYQLSGTQYQLHYGGESYVVRTPLLGEFAVYNTLAALSVALAMGHPLESLVRRIGDVARVPGRLESLDEGQPFTVLVDYAHTEAAYQKLLPLLDRLRTGRLFIVFGCGGRRDRERRPRLTQLLAATADHVFATADNPRDEPLEGIFADMRAGLAARAPVTFVDDRRRAISLALDAAGAGDLVLIAGKGHEMYQEIGHTLIPFDDRAVARELLRLKQGKERA